jgi:hypothetical protein
MSSQLIQTTFIGFLPPNTVLSQVAIGNEHPEIAVVNPVSAAVFRKLLLSIKPRSHLKTYFYIHLMYFIIRKHGQYITAYRIPIYRDTKLP